MEYCRSTLFEVTTSETNWFAFRDFLYDKQSSREMWIELLDEGWELNENWTSTHIQKFRPDDEIFSLIES